MLVKLCSGSALAFKILYEFNISSILKDVLSTFYLSHGAPSPHMIGGHCNQVCLKTTLCFQVEHANVL